MTDYDNTNSGALFKNDKKETTQHPDYKGQINVDGTEFWLSAWLKTSKQGAKFMSLSVKRKEQKQRPAQANPAGSGFDDMADDVPF